MRAWSISSRNWEGNLRSYWGNAKVSFPFSATRGRRAAFRVAARRSRVAVRRRERAAGLAVKRRLGRDRAGAGRVGRRPGKSNRRGSTIARTFASVTPPEASEVATTTGARAAQLVGRHVVEEHRSNRRASACSSWAGACPPRPVSETPRPSVRAWPTALGDQTCDVDVVVLDEHRIVKPEAMIDAAANRDGVPGAPRQPGRCLARVLDRDAGSLDRAHHGRVGSRCRTGDRAGSGSPARRRAACEPGR